MIALDIFCDWFTGRWNNRAQAHSNPRGQAYVMARHDRISDTEFRCVYHYHRDKTPYRDFTLSINGHDSDIILTDKETKLVYSLYNGVYTCHFDEVIKGKRYVFDSVLTNTFYRLNDQCFEGTRLVRGLETGEFYEFKKVTD